MRQRTILCTFMGCSLFAFVNWCYIFQSSDRKARLSGSSIEERRKTVCAQQLRNTLRYCEDVNIPIPCSEHKSTHASFVRPNLGDNTTLTSETTTKKAFLTIGIPSVRRLKEDYANRTLRSILTSSSGKERRDVVVVLLLADEDYNVRQKRHLLLAAEFSASVRSGFLHIVQMDPTVYPPLTGLRNTYNDPPKRVRWRSKQVVDFAYLFNYSIPLSEYFLILEDDVICAPNYITAINEFVQTQKSDWVSLTFSGFLIIGRLFKTEDLKRLVPFLLMFYSEKPVDFLILQFIDLLVPGKNKNTRRIPSLFQHIGIQSSLHGKSQRMKDRTFTTKVRKFHVVNPQADIVTTMETYESQFPELAYGSVLGFFWAKTPKFNDTFDIILNKPTAVQRIYIQTGNPDTRVDVIKRGIVEVSPRFVSMLNENKANCEGFVNVASFQNGIADVTLPQPSLNSTLVQCVRIRVLEKQHHWLIISEIDIFT